ncbi:MAG: 3-oxoacyl-ACP reductase family protein [Patescibacteria group bacterium]
MKLQNKVALITGSSRGIGKAIALEFAKEGAKVVVNYNKSQKEADKIVSEIENLGSEAIALKADVSNENDIKQMVEQTVKKFGKIDILVNNAGIVFDIPFMEKTVEQWRKTLDTNLIGVFLCCKYAIPHIPEGGRIINISSTNGLGTVSTDSMDYDASKAGVIAITKSLAKELAPKILVNSIAPGWVDTDINKYLPEDYVKSEMAQIGVKRFGKPEEIAKMAVFLASDDSSYVAGTTIVVDGGMVY